MKLVVPTRLLNQINWLVQKGLEVCPDYKVEPFSRLVSTEEGFEFCTDYEVEPFWRMVSTKRGCTSLKLNHIQL